MGFPTLNLKQYIKDIIKSQINNVGLVELGHLRFTIDSYLAAGPDNLKFCPCEISDVGELKILFKDKLEDRWHRLDVTIPAVIAEQERELNENI